MARVQHQNQLPLTQARDSLSNYFARRADVQFAVLIGSHVDGTSREGSDWDIAIQWEPSVTGGLSHLAHIEFVRKDIAELLGLAVEKIDLIDVCSTQLAMRENIANTGLTLTDPEALPWLHFLQRTWRDLEDAYWEALYVA